ncbi:MAG: M3 family metallopeptidase [bacterium]|nr:M3 family metallopeptidase [bacterium]
MVKAILFVSIVSLMFISCTSQSGGGGGNPFLTEFDTPFGVPPFDEIRTDHYLPAFAEGMSQHRAEIDAIVNNSEAATFENTIEALEYSGELLAKVSNIFYSVNDVMTNEEMQSVAEDVAPDLAKHGDDISLNEALFAKVKSVYDQRDDLDLNTEQSKLLEDTYKGFVRGGANLGPEEKDDFRAINEELSIMTLKFGDNVLKENNKFKLVIDNEEDLAGLPDAVITGASETAEELGEAGKWVFTLHKPSLIPFITYSEKRELREQIYKAYINRGNNNDELDNKEIASRVSALRYERARLLGYETHAHFVLEESMAKVPQNVYDLLDQLWRPALAKSKTEAREFQAMIDREGGNFKLESWDWWYYADRVKKEKYALDDSQLKPYFKLENVIQGAFDVASRLWGITFKERFDLPKYHEDVKVFEVKEADGSHLAILYTDYFPRSTKRGGAWMNSYRDQYRTQDGTVIYPIITNNGNFSKPTGDEPSLITFEEVSTLFHEFGHALHGLLSNCTYPSLSGTAVPRDFVELPSQIMENWAGDPTVMKTYAKHYQTGEPIPDELINKIKNAGTFNQGFITVEYLAASYLDMDWHTLTESGEQDAMSFEDGSLGRIGLIPEIITRYRTPYFSHIFAGGYSSGYYSYIWAEVLDQDAFEAFRENGIFDSATALSFRENILAKGGTEDPMALYLKFRGSEPKIDGLLKKRGLK